jgi:alkylhydroperoxidase family enzyme
VSRALGITEDELTALSRFRESDLFSPADKAALELAEAMTAVPADVSDELRSELHRHFSQKQIMELTSNIAWENHRARLNRALGVREVGFSDGAFCLLPEHR